MLHLAACGFRQKGRPWLAAGFWHFWVWASLGSLKSEASGWLSEVGQRKLAKAAVRSSIKNKFDDCNTWEYFQPSAISGPALPTQEQSARITRCVLTRNRAGVSKRTSGLNLH